MTTTIDLLGAHVVIDWAWVLPIIGFWLAFGFAFLGLIWAAGAWCDHRAAQRQRSLPLAPVIPLDLGRERRAQVRRRNSA